MGATGIEPMTSTVSSTMKTMLDKGFSVLGFAKLRRTAQKIVILHLGRTRHKVEFFRKNQTCNLRLPARC